MSLLMGSEMQGMYANWRLGPDADTGWFDTRGSQWITGKFVLATVFKLHWRLDPGAADGIYNLLHAVTMGRACSPGKTHLEQLAQILHGDLHITCRITDSFGLVQRNTVALPGSWQRYQGRAMLLIYTGDPGIQNPTLVQTTNTLYDLASMDQLQSLQYCAQIRSSKDLDFASWPTHRVVCDYEQNNVPRDHVMVHGNCHHDTSAQTPFELLSVWGSLGQTLDPSDRSIVEALTQNQVSDRIGPAEAWYNCHCDRVITQGPDRWALCTGRYQQSNRLGILLSRTGQDRILV